MAAFLQDLRYARRQLAKNGGFTAVAVLTLALGIGANLAVFSVSNAVLLNPSGTPHAERVVAPRVRYRIGDLANIGLSAPDFGDIASAKDLFSAAAVERPGSFNYLPAGGMPERLQAAMVSWQWFDVFLAEARLGRGFRPEEDVPGANHEVVLSYSSWQRRFGGDPNILGRKLMLNEQPYEVIGVMGAEFAWPNQAEVWAPLALPPQQFHDRAFRYNENLFAVARMRPSVTLEKVNTFLAMKAEESLAAEGSDSYGRASGWGMFAMPLIELVSGKLRTPLAILLAAVALLLLIACANIAGLQLARATARRREVSIAIALGAGRARIIQHALVENLLLAIAGGALGIVFARLTVPVLLQLAPPALAGNLQVRLDSRVLAFAGLSAIVCALLCGIAPAWHMARIGSFQALQESGRSETPSHARQRLRSALVVAQIAAAMLLMVGAGLLVRSLEKVETVQTGIDPRRLMTAVVTLPGNKYDNEESWAAFTRALEDQLRAQAAVQDVAISDSLPFDGMGGAAGFIIVGRPMGPNDPGAHGNVRSISPGYFSTLRIPVLRGRTFADTDRKGTAPVAIVDDVMARQYWPNQDPVGQRIAFQPKDPPITIVGVVKHARSSSLEDDGSEGSYFLPIAQSPSPQFSFAVRGHGAPQSLVSIMRAAVRAVDPSQSIYDLKTMSERVDASLLGRRFLVVLLSVFAGLALVLSGLGLYGVVNYSVKLRFRELGIRLALGAQRGDVLRLVLSQGVRLALCGIPIGIAGVLLAGRALASVLYQVSLLNPLTLVMTSLILAGTVLVASYLPAQRSAQMDPMQSLREE